MAEQAPAGEKASVSQRLLEEVKKYAVVSGYLFISFSLLLLWQAEIAAEGGKQTALPFGLAAVKALVLGKFLLIGDAINPASRAASRPMLQRVAWRSVTMLGLLVAFVAIEELVIGLVHDKTVNAIIAEVMNRSLLENIAPVGVMLLILIPLISVSETYRQLGAGGFKRLWLEPPA